MTVNKRNRARKQSLPKRSDDLVIRRRGRRATKFSGMTIDIKRDWAAGLPEDLVDDISERLPVVSTLSMGASCVSWRHIIAEEKKNKKKTFGLPWLVLRGQNHRDVRTCFSILENRVRELSVPEASGRYLFGSFHDWLIVAELQYSKVEFFFWNPFSRTKKLLMPLAWDAYHRMLVSASPNDPNCVVLLLASSSERFACWAPGLDNWHGIFMGEEAFVDAVFCNGLFYLVNSENNIYTIDAEAMISPMKEEDIHGETKNSQLLRKRLRLHQVAMPVKPTRSRMRRYLVESCGEVLLVCRLFLRGDGKFLTTHGFEVFKLDACRMIWVKMESLGDRILFVGRAGSRSFSAAELGSDIGNQIYFVNDEMHLLQQGPEWEDYSPKHCSLDDWGVFNLSSNSFIPSSCNRMKLESWSPIWITAPTWWYLSANNSQISHDSKGIGSF